MPEFAYVALAHDGHKEESTIEAASAQAAGHLLKEQGLLPTEIKQKGASGVMDVDLGAKFSTISLVEKLTFIQNLSIMLKAGIAVSRSLQIQAKQTKNKRFQLVLEDVHSQVETGKSLGEAMEKHPTVFSNIFVSMVKMGELGGSLDKSLEYLGIQLQREADMKSRIKGAMIYPCVIISAMVIIGILMSIYVLPTLTSTLTSAGATLPFTTRIVIAFSNFMSGHAALVIVGLIALVAAAIFYFRTPSGRRAMDWFLLHMMLIAAVDRKINLARFARVLSSLLKSGIPIVEALEVAGQSLDNSFYEELILGAAAQVKVGKSLSDALGSSESLVPTIIVQMLQVGEESGTTAEILEQLATHYEAEVDDTLKNLSSIIEPLLLLVIGVVVGFLAVSIIAPIYSIDNSVSSSS